MVRYFITNGYTYSKLRRYPLIAMSVSFVPEP